MKVLLRVALDTASGYGNDGVGLARALVRLGHEVFVSPVAVTPAIPEEVALLLTRDFEPPFDLAIVHLDPMQLKVEQPVYRVSRKVVGWTMWEYANFLPATGSKAAVRRNLKEGFDALVGYDEVTLAALQPYIPRSVRRFKLQGGFWSEEFSVLDREWDGTFRFCMVGALHQRKDPFVAVQAFNFLREQHGEKFDAELHLKTMSPGLHPMMEEAYPGVHIHYRWWPQDRLRAFYARMHCLLAPSRGEGKNVPALEAQATGIPVIATNWGGHTEWLREEYGYPLGYTLATDGNGMSARADVNELADLMWHVYTYRSEAREKGLLAARTIPAMCDWVPVVRKFLERVETEVPRREIASKL